MAKKLTVKDLLSLKGVRQISFVQIARAGETIAASEATYLFSADLLGENRGHIPRHAKTYRNFALERDRLQGERVATYKEYISDIQNEVYPASEQSVKIDSVEFDQFIESIERT